MLVPFSRLQALLLRRGTLPLADARLYAAEVALGLGGLHDERGALYRDLKPENVLLDGRGAYPPAHAYPPAAAWSGSLSGSRARRAPPRLTLTRRSRRVVQSSPHCLALTGHAVLADFGLAKVATATFTNSALASTTISTAFHSPNCHRHRHRHRPAPRRPDIPPAPALAARVARPLLRRHRGVHLSRGESRPSGWGHAARHAWAAGQDTPRRVTHDGKRPNRRG